jgi:hypothetical protein
MKKTPSIHVDSLQNKHKKNFREFDPGKPLGNPFVFGCRPKTRYRRDIDFFTKKKMPALYRWKVQKRELEGNIKRRKWGSEIVYIWK